MPYFLILRISQLDGQVDGDVALALLPRVFYQIREISAERVFLKPHTEAYGSICFDNRTKFLK